MNSASTGNNSNILDIVLATDDAVALNDEMLVRKLSDYLNQLILTHFEKLVQLLYRIDVSEAKLKYLLKANPDQDAGKTIAHLIIERQIQKIQFKKEMQENERDDGGEERL